MLLKVGEIVLKGGNRHHFERLLQANIGRAVRELGFGVRLWNRNGVMVLRLTSECWPRPHPARPRLKNLRNENRARGTAPGLVLVAEK